MDDYKKGYGLFEHTKFEMSESNVIHSTVINLIEFLILIDTLG